MKPRSQSKAPRIPRFVLLWVRRRSEESVVVCWTWNRYRADMIAAQLEWEGRFEIVDLKEAAPHRLSSARADAA